MPQPIPEPRFAVLALIGARGCGKSAVGRLVARQLGWEFCDTDELVEAAAGQSIAEIFAARGAAAFRQLETQALELALRGRHRVLSVGGGAVLAAHNRELLGTAYRIWLTAPPEELYRRVLADTGTPCRRPPLSDRPGLEEMRQVLAERQPLYESLAQQVIETGGRTAAEVAREILQRLPSGARSTEG